MEQIKTDLMTINMGPQHPSTHGVLRLELKTDGEIVDSCRPYLGYLHRCFEKHCESLDYLKIVPFTDRMDYLAAMNNNWAFALAVEKMMGIEVPEKCEYLRVIVSELNRIASHIIAFGTFGLDIGAFTPFLLAFNQRELIFDLLEEASGARMLYNYIWVGGVARDVTSEWLKKVKGFCESYKPVINEIDDLLSYNKIFVSRAANVGIVPKDLAIDYGFTGPNLRGSGIEFDLRKDEPYSIYDKFDFDVPIGSGEEGTLGDCWDRYMCRIRETRESIKIIEQALEGISLEGDIYEAVPKNFNKMPKGEVYVRSETPRGEMGIYIVSEGGKAPTPYRCKVRSPAFCALSILEKIAKGVMISDIIVILGSIDIVLGEVDR
ncbi:MAG: NADH-quinone oxidoreductase subunit D [Calditrichaeota bacterium]|nr:MAG: NADH-quinone oxidoreductase subunit D [Calditrichota bacterium]